MTPGRVEHAGRRPNAVQCGVTSAPTPSDFLTAYRQGALADFFALPAGDLAGAQAQPRPVDRAKLAAALRQSLAPFTLPAAVARNLERLAHPQSRAIVTGQQSGLLLGPMYTLAKAISAIRLAAECDREAQPVVPIFWVASQDHDSAEISSAVLLDFDEQLQRLTLELPDGVASGRMSMRPEYLTRTLAAIEQGRFRPEFAEEARALLARSAEPAATFADWFTAQLLALLGPYGLIVFDPSKPELAELAAPLLARELDDPLASSSEIVQAGEALRRLGFSPQLVRRQGATNLFIDEEGQRTLLYYADGSFYNAKQRYSREALLALLQRKPGRLTPAAGLRPVVQDALLPTLASVVGPGELRYLAQLKGVYALHGIAMPLIWPRLQLTLLEPPVSRLLNKYQLAPDISLAALEAQLEALLLARHGIGERFAATLDELNQRFGALLSEVGAIDPTLQGAVRRGEAQLQRTVGNLRAKTARALARQDQLTSAQFARLRTHLYPGGAPQERVLSPYSFFLKFGFEPLLKRLLTLPPEGAQALAL